jgi:hypothetical protein
MLPTCVKLLDHSVEDPAGTIYVIDAAHKAPDPNFTTTTPPTFELKFLDAINQDPRADLKVLLQRTGKPDITSFAGLNGHGFSFSVALADLTGDVNDPTSKVFHPLYAAYHDKDSIYPASLMKIAPILAAHQLLFDAQQKAKTASPADSATPAKLKKFVFDGLIADWNAKGLGVWGEPNLGKTLDVDSGGKVILNKTFFAQMDAITHPDPKGDEVKEMNNGMWFTMHKLHTPYMGSAFLQLGLCDQNNGGFWSWSAWGENWTCKGSPTRLYKTQPKTEIFALAAATYMTLLKQRRLVSPSISDLMQTALLDGDLKWSRSALVSSLGAAETADLKMWGKHGAWGPSASEALLVERTTGAGKKIRYVVACFLTSSIEDPRQYPAAMAETDPDFRKVWDVMLRVLVEVLIPAMDGVIVANNP